MDVDRPVSELVKSTRDYFLSGIRHVSVEYLVVQVHCSEWHGVVIVKELPVEDAVRPQDLVVTHRIPSLLVIRCVWGPRDLDLQVGGDVYEVIDGNSGCCRLRLNDGVVPWLRKGEVRIRTDALYVFHPDPHSDFVIKTIEEWRLPECLHRHHARLCVVYH